MERDTITMKANHYYELSAMIMIVKGSRICNCKHKEFSEGMQSRKFYHYQITDRHKHSVRWRVVAMVILILVARTFYVATQIRVSKLGAS